MLGETMKATRTGVNLGLTLAVMLACGGWTRAQQEQGPGAATSASPAKPQNTVRPAIKWKRFDYTCENGAKIVVYLRDTTAKVRFQDRFYLMRQTRSADGNRYSNGKVVWWGKGDGGFLQEDAPEGDGKIIVKDCVLEKPPMQDAVTGTVTYLLRMALPEQATIQVQLMDVSRTDAPATVVAKETFELGKAQVPVPFTLKFNPAKIDPKHSYSISARVLLGSELKFASDKAYPVLTQGNPAKADLILMPVMQQGETPAP
jgi:putative lipoprotein